MLNMTAAEREFLLTATEVEAVTRLEVIPRGGTSPILVIDSREESQVALLPGGSVRVDTAAEVLRTASLSIIDPEHEVSVGIGGTIGPANQFKLFKGYYIPAQGDYTLWPLGVFELSGEPTISAQGGARVIQFQLADKSSIANGRPRGGLKSGLVVSAGTSKLTAITAIAGVETWGETQLNLWQGSAATLPVDYNWDDTASPWEAARRVAELVEPDETVTRLYYDPVGRLTLAPAPGPNLDELPAVWDVRVDPDGLSQLVEASRALDMFKLVNAVQVKYGNEFVTPGVIWAEDSDPKSDTSTVNIKHLMWHWNDGAQDELIKNDAEALARANYELVNRRSYEEKVPFTILENPALEPWDVVYIGESVADIDGNYQLLSFTISLDMNATMSCEGWKVRRLA